MSRRDRATDKRSELSDCLNKCVGVCAFVPVVCLVSNRVVNLYVSSYSLVS